MPGSTTNGYVKIWRSMHDHPVLRGDLAANMTFRFYIESACHKPTPWDVAGEIIELEPGQWFGSLNRVQEITGLSKKQVRRAENKLESAGMLEVRPKANRGRLVTVCQYCKYQSTETPQGQTKGTTKGQTEGTTEGTPINKKEEGRSKKQAADLVPLGREFSRCCEVVGADSPDDSDWKWLNDLVDDDRYESLDLADELTRYADYWSDRKKSDHPKSVKLSIRNWLNKATKYKKREAPKLSDDEEFRREQQDRLAILQGGRNA